MRERLLRSLQSARGPWLLIGFAVLLSAPSLALGLLSDDHMLRVGARYEGRPFQLFATAPARVAAERQSGMFPWWSSPHLHFNFFRPLSSISHWAEFNLYPDAAWAMHLVNVVAYGLLVLVAVQLYRTLLPDAGRVAALAGLMFAIADGHASSVGWIAGRNTLLATLFGLTALLLHLRGHKLASALSTALALCSAESGVATLAYLIAYAAIFEAGSWQRRLRGLAPQLIVFSIWACVYVALGCGAHGTSFYRDPTQPLDVLAGGFADLGIWFSALLGPSLVTALIPLPALPVRLALLLLALPFLLALWLAVPRTRVNAFFCLGGCLCLPPLFTALPQERLLMFASLGAFGLIASLIVQAAHDARRFVRVMRGVLIALHLVLAPLLFIAQLAQTRPLDIGARAMIVALPSVLPKQVIYLNTPMELMGLYTHSILREERAERPRSIQQLYCGASALTIQRSAVDSLDVRAERGWGNVPFERVTGALSDLPRAGSELDYRDMHVSVLESDETGHPTLVRFRFPSPLEASDRAWVVWRGTRPVRWQPLAIGETLHLAGLTPFTSIDMRGSAPSANRVADSRSE